jgi:uncharacterized DUF497 family protein
MKCLPANRDRPVGMVAIQRYGKKYGFRVNCHYELRVGRCKNTANLVKHHVSFFEAQFAFADPNRVVARDLSHSKTEERFYCFGRVQGGVLTVRFTDRGGEVSNIGAGYWRKGKAVYEKENHLHE